MAKISRDKIKKHGFGRFLLSFRYSMEGLIYAYKYEQSMLIHAICTVLTVIFNVVFRVSAMEWLITLLALAIVLISELLNTAIEAVVDMVTLEIHPLAKIAKDCGSAATFVSSLSAGVVIGIIYIPHIISLLGL